MIKEKKAELEQKANAKFDSSKNWSIMIDKEQNEIRNEIMRKFKYQQLKRQLHETIREKKNEIQERKKKKEEEEKVK